MQLNNNNNFVIRPYSLRWEGFLIWCLQTPISITSSPSELLALDGMELDEEEFDYRLGIFTSAVLDDGDLDGDDEWVKCYKINKSPR